MHDTVCVDFGSAVVLIVEKLLNSEIFRTPWKAENSRLSCWRRNVRGQRAAWTDRTWNVTFPLSWPRYTEKHCPIVRLSGRPRRHGYRSLVNRLPSLNSQVNDPFPLVSSWSTCLNHQDNATVSAEKSALSFSSFFRLFAVRVGPWWDQAPSWSVFIYCSDVPASVNYLTRRFT